MTLISELVLVGVAEMLPADSSVVVRLYCLEDDLILSVKERHSTLLDHQRARDYFDDAATRIDEVGGVFHMDALSNDVGSLIQIELPCRSVVTRDLELEALAFYAPKDATQSDVLSNALLRCGYRCEKWSEDSVLDQDGDVPVILDYERLNALQDQTKGQLLNYPNVVVVCSHGTVIEPDIPATWLCVEEPVFTARFQDLLA